MPLNSRELSSLAGLALAELASLYCEMGRLVNSRERMFIAMILRDEGIARDIQRGLLSREFEDRLFDLVQIRMELARRLVAETPDGSIVVGDVVYRASKNGRRVLRFRAGKGEPS